MKNIFLTMSVVISLSAYIVGIYSIIRGNFRPQRMTRFLLLLISLLFVGTLFAQGDRNAIYLALVTFIGTLAIFILSIKKGIGGTTKLDLVVFFMALFSLVVWYTTKNPILGLSMSIITDFIAFFPTLVKSWILPETEEWKFYILDVFSSLCSLLSISVFTFGKVIFPIYMVY